MGRFDPRVISHFESASWQTGQNFQIPELKSLKQQIMSIPALEKVYMRHADATG